MRLPEIVDSRAYLLSRVEEKVTPKLQQISQVKEGRKRTDMIERELVPILMDCPEIPDWAERSKILALLTAKFKVQGRGNKYVDYLRDAWKYIIVRNPRIFATPLSDWWKNNLTIPAFPHSLPQGSWLLLVSNFELAKDFISMDDDACYIIDNPVKKDKVFRIPFIAPSTWKGSLHWAAMNACLLERLAALGKAEAFEGRTCLVRLFGNEKEDTTQAYLDKLFDKFYPSTNGTPASKEFANLMKEKGYVSKEGLRQGRLFFYPTFFDLISLNVLNPHERRTRTGTVPIIIELVPGVKDAVQGAKGNFSLLYIPFDLVNSDSERLQREAREDLKVTAEAVKAMMLTYGFSAKKSSGYGVIKSEVDGKLWTNNKDIAPQLKQKWIEKDGAFYFEFKTLNNLVAALKGEE